MHKLLIIWQRRYFLFPLVIFMGLVWFLWRGLAMDPKVLPSAMLNKPLPKFSNVVLESPQRLLSNQDLQGKIGILHVWASWCQTCLAEHSVWMKLAASPIVAFYSVDYRDKSANAEAWLDLQGDPYVATLVDTSGQLGIDLGVQGTPETFIFDQKGIIRYKWQGPMTLSVWHEKILPIIQRLKKAMP